MSITTNYILQEEERKKKQAQTAPVSVPQDAVSQNPGGVVPPGAIEGRTANYINQQLQQSAPAIQQPQDDFDYSNKPEIWSDDEYKAIRQLYSDEQIQQSFANPDPENFLEGIYTKMYKNNVPAPRELDEKGMKRQRTIAGIGDILGLVSQAVSGSQGAINRPRSFDQSAYGQLTKKQQEMYDRYRDETDRYGRELVDAQMKDYLSGMQDWKQTQANIAKSLNDYRQYQIDIAKQNQDAAYKNFQVENTKRRTAAYEKNTEAQIEDRKRRTDISARNAANSAARTQAYVEKLKNPTTTSTGSKADYQLVVPASANDPQATKDQFGNPVRVFGMSTGEMDQYARQALADGDFMEQHHEFNLISGQKHTADERRNIAATYLEGLYGKQFSAPNVDATTQAGNKFLGQAPQFIAGPGAEEEIEEPFDPALDAAELDEMFQVVY